MPRGRKKSTSIDQMAIDETIDTGVDEDVETDAAPDEALPQRIMMTRPHGFIDTDGTRKMWPQGQVVTAPEDIALLISRGCGDFKILA